jgi:hypothetical protein
MGLRSWIRDPEKNLFRIPDPGVKKAPDHGSTTLGNAQIFSPYMRRSLVILYTTLHPFPLNFQMFEENFILFFISVAEHFVCVERQKALENITWPICQAKSGTNPFMEA